VLRDSEIIIGKTCFVICPLSFVTCAQESPLAALRTNDGRLQLTDSEPRPPDIAQMTRDKGPRTVFLTGQFPPAPRRSTRSTPPRPQSGGPRSSWAGPASWRTKGRAHGSEMAW